LAERHELLIIDTAGFGDQAAMVAAAGADLVLVPVTPGEGDLVEAQRTVSYVEELGRSTRRAIPVRVLANRIRRATTLSRHVLAQLEALGLPRVQTVLSEAVAYGEISFSGGAADRWHVSHRNRGTDGGASRRCLVAEFTERRKGGYT
jgi:chromosome partitioning protein